jgi:hypothetical protein
MKFVEKYLDYCISDSDVGYYLISKGWDYIQHPFYDIASAKKCIDKLFAGGTIVCATQNPEFHKMKNVDSLTIAKGFDYGSISRSYD